MTVPRYQARVLVRLRPSVLDPAGEATRGAAERLGVEGISKLRIGKAVELEVEAPDAEEARRRLEVLSDRLLANPSLMGDRLLAPRLRCWETASERLADPAGRPPPAR